MAYKIFFVAYGGGHIGSLLPVIRAMKDDEQYEVKILALTSAKACLDGLNIPSVGFKDYFLDRKESVDYGKVLEEDVSGVIDRQESIAYLGMSYRDLILECGVRLAKERYDKYGRHCFNPIGSLREIIDMERPDVVVTTSAPRAERAAVIAATELNIKSVVLVDLFGTKEVEWLGKPCFGTKICVGSKFTYDLLVESGRSSREIVMTGNPAFDELVSSNYSSAITKYRFSHALFGKKVFLWASQELYSDSADSTGERLDLSRAITEKLCEIFSRHPEWVLLYRPHPNQKPIPVSSYENVILCCQATPLQVALSVSDAVFVITSTVGLEAALLGKPVLTFEGASVSHLNPYSRLGIAYPVRSVQEIEAALEYVVSGAFRSDGAGLVSPGGATKRLIKVINDVISVA